MVKKADVPHLVIDAAMRVAAAKGWGAAGMADIAAAARLSLAEVYRHYPTKAHILGGLTRHADLAVLAEEAGDGAEGSARDRLFDVLMRRFDALQPYREGIRAIARGSPGDPLSALAALPRLSRSMAWMLEAAGIDAGGPGGLLRAQALTLIWTRVLGIWLDDDTADSSRTMAALDARLRRAELLARTFSRRPRGSDGGAASAPEAPLASE